MQISLAKTAEIDAVPISPIPAVNVASVPQRSPLRYPGGKTWLIPHIRVWLKGISPKPVTLIEPFAGGGVVSLTAVMEDLVQQCLLSELDPHVAAFWQAALFHNEDLRECIAEFVPTREKVEALQSSNPQTVLEKGFRTLVLNRTRRGGILAKGASLSRSGENGKGLMSRWYPKTTVARLEQIDRHSSRIDFRHTDGLQLLEEELGRNQKDTVVFADPPYTYGGKRAGNRLYDAYSIDHRRLFSILSESDVAFLLTYDKSPEILSLVSESDFHVFQVLMKNTHHARLPELVITRSPVFDNA